MHATLQLTVIGKVFKSNEGKVLSLNRDLDRYASCVRRYRSFKPTSRKRLHKGAYKKAKQMFELKTALLQSARDKAVEIHKSFKKFKGKTSEIHLRKCCMRFDERSFKFIKTDKDSISSKDISNTNPPEGTYPWNISTTKTPQKSFIAAAL